MPERDEASDIGAVRQRGPIAAAIGMVAIGALALAACGGDSSNESGCGADPSPALAPSGKGAAAFTMVIRVNQSQDVAQIESDLADRILPRDVFMINTEFPTGSPDDAKQALEQVSEKFPCNRIMALNGLGTDPKKQGYAHTLVGESELDAVLVDWEPDTWADAGKGAWTTAEEENLTRIADQLALLSKELASTKTRMGLVPEYIPPWDYGRIARVIALKNFELDPEHRGYQIVQTQPNCGTPSAPGPLVGPLATQLVRQYRPLFRLEPGPKGFVKADQPSRAILGHLGFEIAFDETPNPHASEAVERIGPKQAASCSKEIVNEGGGAIVYWASSPSMKAMLETAVGRSLRPPSSS